MKPLFNYTWKQTSIEDEIWEVCDEVSFDVAMIEVITWNSPLMDKE